VPVLWRCEGRAVVRECARTAAQRHVDGASEGQELHRHQTLVVVGGDDGVELALQRAHESGVGGQRARDRDPLLRERREGGPQDLLVLAAEEAVLAGVRVHAADRDAPPLGAEPRQLAVTSRTIRASLPA
jgi:hypothetical protein